MVRLDDTNLIIMRALQKDARTTIAELARVVGRSETTVRDRVAALESHGYLRGYQALVDLELMGYKAFAVVRASCDMERIDDVTKALRAIPEITRADLMTGDQPLVVQIVAADLTALEDVVERKLADVGLREMSVEVALRSLVETRPPRVIPVATTQPTSNGNRNGRYATAINGAGPVRA